MANSKSLNNIEQFLQNSRPVILLPSHLKAYIEEIVSQCKDEVSWIMEVTEHENFLYEIEAVFVPRQKVNGATTEFEAEDIAHLMDNEPNFRPEKWRGWGHSHVNMPVSPSGQDKTTMLEFANSCDDFFVGMIHNKRGEIFCWLIDNTRKIFFTDVELQFTSEYKDEVQKLLKERVSKLVTTTKYQQNMHKPYHKHTSKFRGYTLEFDRKWVEGAWNEERTHFKTGSYQEGYVIEGIFIPAKTAAEAVEKFEDLNLEDATFIDPGDEQKPPKNLVPSSLPVYDEFEDWGMDYWGF